jgi:hypothetical protein
VYRVQRRICTSYTDETVPVIPAHFVFLGRIFHFTVCIKRRKIGSGIDKSVLEYFLPKSLLDNFEIKKVKELSNKTGGCEDIHIYLEEYNKLPEGYDTKDYESKGIIKKRRTWVIAQKIQELIPLVFPLTQTSRDLRQASGNSTILLQSIGLHAHLLVRKDRGGSIIGVSL